MTCFSRIDDLARLGNSMITLTGGEPLLHPDIEDIIRHIRKHNMIITLITNGYLLTKKKIQELNEAGLQGLQISIDNIVPDDISMKSLKVLDSKLKLLREHAEFSVNINSVLGVSDERTPDAIEIAKRATELGFFHTVGILHDDHGNIEPLTDIQHSAYNEIMAITKSKIQMFNYYMFQKNLMEGKPNNWKCRAGARYLYICEDGLVHWCSQQRGYPGIPLDQYTVDDIRREFRTKKNCASHCTVNCVYQSSVLEGWRGPQTLADPTEKSRQVASDLVQITPMRAYS